MEGVHKGVRPTWGLKGELNGVQREKSLNSMVTERIMIWGGELYSQVIAREFVFTNTDRVPGGGGGWREILM